MSLKKNFKSGEYMMRFFVTKIVCLFFLFFVSDCVADSGVVREGADAFRNGEFEQAAKAFEKAAEDSPRDLRLTYNHGVALAASGNLEGAIEVLRKSAIDPEPKIAVLSLNSLAQIHINQAKQQLPENQNETPPEKRNEILELADKSEQYYMDILELEPDNQNVRHNIEVLRSWKTDIKSQWDQADRNKKRQSNLYDRLDWIDNWQHDIANAIAQSKKIPNSPKKYQELYETAEKQQHLIGEIDAIRGDLEKQLQAENTQANDQIANVFNKIRETATEVKQSLDKLDDNNALNKAEQSNRQLSQLKFSLAPFEKIVEQAEKFQTQLVNNNPSSNELAKDDNEQNNRNVNSAESELQHQVNDQQLIASLMPLMLYRAKEGLEAKRSQNLPSQPSNNPPQTNPTQPDTANTADIDPQQKSMELAIKYEPEIRQLAENAATLLSQNNHADALPKQKQSQKLLREILNQQNQNDQNQQNNQEQNQNQNNQNDQNNQENKNEDNKESNDKNDQKNNEQKNSQQPKSADQKQEENKNEITDAEKLRQTEKAERLMRQVKRKQQEANERREELKNYFLQPAPVDKDW
ncbi:MAG: tetratricopeptide repeat protein [Planctomycetaceae bacterium]|jgi:hypothetical protein|nr:tetratricopeptide repeat protein [Planctomycetaceae bacterium]